MADRKPKYFYEVKWECCFCINPRSGGMDGRASAFCPQCRHARCQSCSVQTVKRRMSEFTAKTPTSLLPVENTERAERRKSASSTSQSPRKSRRPEVSKTEVVPKRGSNNNLGHANSALRPQSYWTHSNLSFPERPPASLSAYYDTPEHKSTLPLYNLNQIDPSLSRSPLFGSNNGFAPVSDPLHSLVPQDEQSDYNESQEFLGNFYISPFVGKDNSTISTIAGDQRYSLFPQVKQVDQQAADCSMTKATASSHSAKLGPEVSRIADTCTDFELFLSSERPLQTPITDLQDDLEPQNEAYEREAVMEQTYTGWRPSTPVFRTFEECMSDIKDEHSDQTNKETGTIGKASSNSHTEENGLIRPTIEDITDEESYATIESSANFIADAEVLNQPEQQVFTVEEIAAGDEDYLLSSDQCVRPWQYEDAESETEELLQTATYESIQPISLQLSRSTDDELSYRERMESIAEIRRQRRLKRRAKSLKRERSVDIDSGIDENDVAPFDCASTEVESSARRLRRKTDTNGISSDVNHPSAIIHESPELDSDIEVVQSSKPPRRQFDVGENAKPSVDIADLLQISDDDRADSHQSSTVNRPNRVNDVAILSHKTDIQRRCLLIDPPIEPEILLRLPSFKRFTREQYVDKDITQSQWMELEMNLIAEYNNHMTGVKMGIRKDTTMPLEHDEYSQNNKEIVKHPELDRSSSKRVLRRGENMEDDDNRSTKSDISNAPSLASIADSIFSYVSGSSMSSVAGSVSAGERFVALLLADNIIYSLCSEGLASIDPDRFERNFRRMLKGFAMNLRKEAGNVQQRKAAHFVSFRARNSAHIVCNYLSEGDKIVEKKPAAVVARQHEIQEEVDDMEFEDSSSNESEGGLNDFQHLELFIRNSVAITLLRRKLREFVYPLPPNLAIVALIAQNHEDEEWVENAGLGATQNGEAECQSEIVSLLPRTADHEPQKGNVGWQWKPKWPRCTPQLGNLLIAAGLRLPPVIPGKLRVEWRCKCGHRIADDFIEARPGGIERYRNELRQNSKESDRVSTSRSTTKSLTGSFRGFHNIFSSVFKVNDSVQGGLPLHSLPGSSAQTRVIPPSEHAPLPEDLLFLLLCYSEGRYATRLLQLDLVNLNATSDKALFKLLRMNYLSMRPRFTSFFSLRTLEWIKFVHFEMYRSELVDVRKVDDIPPSEHVEYKYTPAPPDVIPPVGDRHMMHLFQNPDCADDETLCLSRFPKKLREKLKCQGGINPGWGLQFVEGWDFRKLWILVFVLFGFGSMVLGVLWAVYRHSIQDAFAIAAYMMTFSVLTVGLVQALLTM